VGWDVKQKLPLPPGQRTCALVRPLGLGGVDLPLVLAGADLCGGELPFRDLRGMGMVTRVVVSRLIVRVSDCSGDSRDDWGT
jgi:hypothetical protein